MVYTGERCHRGYCIRREAFCFEMSPLRVYRTSVHHEIRACAVSDLYLLGFDDWPVVKTHVLMRDIMRMHQCQLPLLNPAPDTSRDIIQMIFS